MPVFLWKCPGLKVPSPRKNPHWIHSALSKMFGVPYSTHFFWTAHSHGFLSKWVTSYSKNCDCELSKFPDFLNHTLCKSCLVELPSNLRLGHWSAWIRCMKAGPKQTGGWLWSSNSEPSCQLSRKKSATLWPTWNYDVNEINQPKNKTCCNWNFLHPRAFFWFSL